MSGLGLGQLAAHGFAKLTGAQRAAGATSPVAATASGSVVLPDGTEMMRSASGGIGIAVTPSPWNSAITAIDFGLSGSISADDAANYVEYGNNFYRGSGGIEIYKSNGAACKIELQTDGSFKWRVAPSGIAGNPISFIQAMTLDASLNVGIGTDNPNAKLSIRGDTGVAKCALRIKPTNEAAALDSVRTVAIECSGNDSTLALGYSTTRDAFVITSTYGSTGTFKPLVLATSDQDRVTLDLSGNFGLGVTPSAWNRDYKVHQVGSTASFYGRVTTPMTGMANNAYRDASGNWLYQTTGVPAVRYEQNTGSHIWYTVPSGTTGNPISFIEVMRLDADGNLVIAGGGSIGFSNNTGARAGSSGQYIIAADSGGLYQQAGGSYYLVTTASGATSDASLKTNVTPLARALERVEAIRGVNFEFIEQPLCAADQGIQLGVIAQEVEAQFPEIVLTGKDGTKTVRYDRLVAPLIEAVKELSAQNRALMARVAALESA